jgi:hypothetical protein
MTNPYVQVALTYIRRPFSSFDASLMFFACLGMTTIVLRSSSDGHVWPSALIVLPFVFVPVAMHIKEQFASPRAHLTPGFRRAHLVVAAASASVLAILLPAWWSWVAGVHSIGLVAVAVCLFGITFWYVLVQSRWLNWLLTAAWCFAMLSHQDHGGVLDQLVSGHSEPQCVGWLVVGVLIAVLGAVRLARLSEDMPEYHRRIRTRRGAKDQMTGQRPVDDGMAPRGLKDWFVERHMDALTRYAAHASASWWSRACRWQAGITFGWAVWFWGLGAVIFYQIVFWRERPADVMLLCPGLVFAPAFITATQWTRRASALAYELLMPVKRASYLLQLGTAAALSQLQLWGAISISLLIWRLLAVREAAPLIAVANILVISGLCQVWLFGMVVFLSLYDDLFPNVVVGAVAVVIPICLVFWPGESMATEWQFTIWLVAGLFAMLGLLLAWAAYRRWLVADLD